MSAASSIVSAAGQREVSFPKQMLRGRASILSNPRLFCRGSGCSEQRFSAPWYGSAAGRRDSFIRDSLRRRSRGSGSIRGATLGRAFGRVARMLSPKTQTNLANAKGYFEEHLCADDYYAENGRVQGVWMGAGAALLGLEGVVTRETFLSLCDNRHPSSGKRLTQRQKTTRNDKVGGEAANRRVCFDFTISPPKSVSIAALVADDSRIVAAHREAVAAAVAELEGFASARFRVFPLRSVPQYTFDDLIRRDKRGKSKTHILPTNLVVGRCPAGQKRLESCPVAWHRPNPHTSSAALSARSSKFSV